MGVGVWMGMGIVLGYGWEEGEDSPYDTNPTTVSRFLFTKLWCG